MSLCTSTEKPTTIEELQLRNHHSFLYRRITHLSLHNNGHINNLQEHLERMHCGYLSLRDNRNTRVLSEAP